MILILNLDQDLTMELSENQEQLLSNIIIGLLYSLTYL